MALNLKLAGQLFRFGIVGSLAAAVHFSIVISLVEIAELQPLVANIFAFMISFQVSYFGHRRFTFAALTEHRVALPRLLLVSSSAFAANEGLYYLFLTLFHLPYALALFLVLAILPLLTFTISKVWVFR